MSLGNPKVVDAIGTDTTSTSVILSIIDGWDWVDQRHHLEALQEKLNSYFEFVESGQLFQEYPNAKDQALCIEVIGKFPMPNHGIRFMDRAREVAAKLDITLRYRLEYR